MVVAAVAAAAVAAVAVGFLLAVVLSSFSRELRPFGAHEVCDFIV